MVYAQIDNENICVGVSQLSGEVSYENMIKIDKYDAGLLGKKYDNGKWVENIIPPKIEEPTENEIFRAEMMLNQCKMLINQENQDMVLAEILLNGLGV